MDIGLYFDYGGETLRIPINPESLTVKAEGKNEIVEVVNTGEVSLLKSKGLRQISFESFFPKNSSHPSVTTKSGFVSPTKYINFFNKVRSDKKPLLFVITGSTLDSQVQMSVENFEWTQEAMDDDVQYLLDLKEYKPIAVKITDIPLSAVREVPPNTTATGSGRSGDEIVIGSTVIVNGTLHKDSYGSSPGLTEVNATRLVSNIKEGRSHPYHVTLMNGGWRGWVTADSVVLA